MYGNIVLLMALDFLCENLKMERMAFRRTSKWISAVADRHSIDSSSADAVTKNVLDSLQYID